MNSKIKKPFGPAAAVFSLALMVLALNACRALAENNGHAAALAQLKAGVRETGFNRQSPPVAVPAPAVAADNEPIVEIVIYHTNDMHGNIAPSPDNPSYGGAAALATLLKREKRPHVWIDSGDWFQGTPEGNLTRGAAVFDIFNRLGLTAGAIGNHDFDFGEAALKDLAKKAGFPVLGANIFSEASGGVVSYARPYTIVQANGVKIGIFGVITRDMQNLTIPDNIKGLNFGDEKTAATKAVRDLKAEGADIIIAASHLGVEEYRDTNYGIKTGDFSLAKDVPGIDVILGGHTHTDIRPDSVCTMNSCGTVVVQTNGKLRKVYRLVLSVGAKTGRIKNYTSRELNLNHASYPPDAEIAGVVAGYTAMAEKEMNKVIGSASMELSKGGAGESLMGTWMTDTLRKYGKTDIGLINTHGITSGLKAGRIKYGDVYRAAPFENHVTKVEIAGSELKKAAENSLYANSISLQFSGVEITYDPSAKDGGKLRGMKVGGVPVSDDRIYTITTVDFLAMAHKTLNGVQRKITEITPLLMRDLLAKEAAENSPISSSIKGWLKTTSSRP